MLQISGFQTSEKIFEEAKFVLYRGYRELDGQRVLIKALRTGHPSIMDQTTLKSEMHLTRKLQFPTILQPISLDLSQGALVFEYFEGMPPESGSFFRDHGLKGFLNFACKTTLALLEAHQHDVVHQNIRPINILYEPRTGEVKLLGFAITSLKEERISEEGLRALLGTLAYMSPEQTGRLNCTVGVASDLYSLGVTFYELLSGLKPFASNDPMELVHSHLAREPRNLRALNEQVPQPIAEMVLKLLQKTPQDRYRSLFGLAKDLEKAAAMLENKGSIDPFSIGANDVSPRFVLPQKLYGRSLELEVAQTAFHKACRGQTRLLLVNGPSGIGKTALVNELRKSIAHNRGYFVRGGNEQNKVEIPYGPFIEAFDDLVHQILTESPREVNHWCRQIQESLGPMGHALVNLIPDLELIIGPQPHLPELEITESKNRFQVALLKLMHVFASKDHPLVIFLDDLQWMCDSTLELMHALLSDPQMAYLLLVGAVREDESRHERPLSEIFEKMGTALNTIHLSPIDLLDIQEMLLDALTSQPDENRSLAELVLTRTDGNPLHVSLYLQNLYDKNLLTYVAKNGAWNWDAALISSQGGTDQDLRDLIDEKTKKLNSEELKVLQLASCIGTRFDLKLLSVAYQHSQTDTAIHLAKAVKEGLLLPLGDGHRLADVCDASDLEAISQHHVAIHYEFLHGRVQQAIYETMNSNACKETHLQVGRLFLEHSHTSHADELIFGIVNQLNRGRELVTGEEERLKLARLNLLAGSKARDSAAYSNAREYLSVAQAILPDNGWELDDRLWFDIHLQLGEMEYFNNNIEAAESIFETMLNQAVCLADKALVFETRVLIRINISRLEDAVAIGLEGLALFGIDIPKEDAAIEEAIAQHWEKMESWLNSHSPAEILALPASHDEDAVHMVNLLMQITPPAFNTNQRLFKLTTLLQVEQVIANGHNKLSAYACAALGILLGMRGDYLRGYEMAELAMEVNRRFPDALVRNRLLFIRCNLVNHWCQPLRQDMATLTRIFRYAEDNGDLVYANYAQLVLSHHRWFLGESLLHILDESERHMAYAAQTRNEAAESTHRFLVHAALNLRGLTLGPDTLDTVDFQLEACLEAIRGAAYFTGVSICRIIQMETYFLRGSYEAAWDIMEKGQELLHFSDNLVMMASHKLYHALLLCWRMNGKEPDLCPEMEELQRIKAQFQQWSSYCGDNFEPMYYLICAEEAVLLGNDLEAMRHYQRANRFSRSNSLRKMEALGHHLASRFFFDRSFNAYGVHHLQTAIAAFNKWGATAIVEDLRRNHAEVLATSAVGLDSALRSSNATSDETLDKITLLKAAQTISGEIHIHKLLTKMMRFVVENAGAQRGVFIYNDDGRLMVGAEWHVDQKEVGIVEEVSLNTRDDLARSMIHYVFRTRSDLVIADLKKDEQFVGDPYLQDSSVQSLLCMPVLRQTELSGILYLENHLARDTFTDDRLEMLRLLTPQMAVSLENARVIANMASLNTTLTREISERKKAEKALRKAQEIAVTNAHNAGKAEFASSVLHNINNVLNTVGLANESMLDLMLNSKIGNFNKVMGMIDQHKDDLGSFFNEDKRGKLIPGYLVDLGEVLNEEQGIFKDELQVMKKHIRLMKDIIETQQKHATGALSAAMVDLVLLCEDAVHIQKPGLDRHMVTVERQYRCEEPVHANKAELTHILINLVKNAIEAMGFQETRTLTLTTGKKPGGQIFLEVADTGAGISEEDMSRMFTHGFTTKQDGHGFGLHYSRQAMAKMGGTLEVTSEGKNKGACFTLTFGLFDPPTEDPSALPAALTT